ncbi:MAG: hypothetical protein HY608_10255 [Planctomycetes bacterium]|nr:hypothetical protein [Planctomycetota bacterium]
MGVGATQAGRDFYRTWEEQGARFVEQFPGLTACPSSIPNVFQEVNSSQVFFWCGANWKEGRTDGGGLGVVQEILDFLAAARSPELAGRTRDASLIADLYNLEGGFRAAYDGTIEKLREIVRKIRSLEERFSRSTYPVDLLFEHLEGTTHYRRRIAVGPSGLPFEEAIPLLAERYVYHLALHRAQERMQWIEELPEQIDRIRLYVVEAVVVQVALGEGQAPSPAVGATVRATFTGATRFPGCDDRPADAEGRASAVALLAESGNEISLEAEKDGLRSASERIDDRVMAASAEGLAVTLRLVAPPATLSVSVDLDPPPSADPAGTPTAPPAPASPIPAVTLLQQGRIAGSQSGTEVVFGNLPAGEVEARVAADGYIGEAQGATLKAGERTELRFSLRRRDALSGTWTITGTCVDPAGEPVADAQVAAGAHPVALDGRGGFTVGPIENPVSSLTVEIAASKGAVTGSVTVGYAAEAATTVRIVLVGDVEITILGRVVDADGAPLPGAVIQIGDRQVGALSDGAFSVTVVVHDGQGTFEVIPSIAVSGGGSVAGAPASVVFRSGAVAYDVGTLSLPVRQPFEAILSGRVVDSRGEGIAGAAVLFRGQSVSSGAGGGFSVGPVWVTRDETVSLQATIALADGTTVASETATAPVTGPVLAIFTLRLDVEQRQQITIRGRVVSQDGLGVPNASVTGPGTGPVTTDGNGAFALPPYEGTLGEGVDVSASYAFPDGQTATGSARAVPSSHEADVSIALPVVFQSAQADPAPDDPPVTGEPEGLPDFLRDLMNDALDGGATPPPPGIDIPFGRDGLTPVSDPDDAGSPADDPDRVGRASSDAASGHNPADILLDAALAAALGDPDAIRRAIDALRALPVSPADAAGWADLLESFGAPEGDVSTIRSGVRAGLDAGAQSVDADLNAFWEWWNGEMDARAAAEAAAEANRQAWEAFAQGFNQGLANAGQGAGGTIDPNSGLTDVTVDASTVTIEVWDHEAEDGDIINILLNGSPVVSNLTISHAHQTFQLNLFGGRNTIEIQAVNAGTSPPNTASVAISNVTRGEATQVYQLDQDKAGAFNIHLQW